MSKWSDWIGREQRQSDILDAALARRWLATFDRDAPAAGTMPQGIHFCLCTPEAATAALGDDGHPARSDSPDSFLPPIPLPRRMWAGSEITFHTPISPGAAIERVSRVAGVTEKDGRSGKLAFVTITRDTNADDVLAVREEQSLVYRDTAEADAALSPPETDEARFDYRAWDVVRMFAPSEAMLFRYSALTFNCHRIHYDAPYARDIERYRGLVVHGPLIATLLLQLAAQRFGDNALSRFAFRGMSPAIAGEPLHLALRETAGGIAMGAFAVDGRQVTKADAILSDRR